MNKKFKSGISQALIYYASGFAAWLLVYQLWGQQTNTFPGPHHIVLMLVLIGGLIWLFYYYALALAKQKYKIDFGALIVHLISMALIIIIALLSI